MEKVKTIVNINGRDYTVVSTEGDLYVNRIAFDLDQRLKATSKVCSSTSVADLYTLTSLNILDELSSTQKELSQLKDEKAELAEELKKAQISNTIAAKEKETTDAAMEYEIKRLRDQCRKLEEENRELKAKRVTSINKTIGLG